MTDGQENRKFLESSMNLEMRKVNRLDVLCNCTSYEITRKVQESSEFELKCQFPSHRFVVGSETGT